MTFVFNDIVQAHHPLRCYHCCLYNDAFIFRRYLISL